jgi:hypothetical protein
MGGVAARRSPLTTAILGSIPGLGVTCELSLLILSLASKGFSPGSPVFLPPQKINIPKFQLDHGKDHKFIS